MKKPRLTYRPSRPASLALVTSVLFFTAAVLAPAKLTPNKPSVLSANTSHISAIATMHPTPTASSVAVLNTAGAATPASTTPGIATSPTWEQNFATQTKLNTSVWRYDTDPSVPAGNNELEGYSPNNVRVQQGTGLIITASKGAYSYPNDPDHKTYDYSSGRIDTKNSFSFSYGRIEATMKLPAGSGAWPAFWLLSANNPYTAGASDAQFQQPNFYLKDGELDIMESYGVFPDQVEGTYNSFLTINKAGEGTAPDDTATFHTYAIEILPDKITWSIDGKAYFSYAKNSDNPDAWPYTAKNKLYPILNLALSSTTPLDTTKAPWTLTVSDVKYYAYQ